MAASALLERYRNTVKNTDNFRSKLRHSATTMEFCVPVMRHAWIIATSVVASVLQCDRLPPSGSRVRITIALGSAIAVRSSAKYVRGRAAKNASRCPSVKIIVTLDRSGGR